jgi:5-methylcytosine-specific restriction protein A
MPHRARTPCTFPGCGVLTDHGRCTQHRRQSRAEADARRPSSTARGYGWRWRQYRAQYLRTHPLCVHCGARHLLTPAMHVDHVEPVDGPDDPRFWDPENHQGLCASCHSIKTDTHDGGFGNR